MEQQPHRACEWTKSNKNIKTKATSYLNSPRVLLFDLAHKQFNGIIKEWLHWRQSQKEDFLPWCLGMVQNQFFLIKKIKMNWKIKNKLLLLSASFTTKFELVFVLTLVNAFS